MSGFPALDIFRRRFWNRGIFSSPGFVVARNVFNRVFLGGVFLEKVWLETLLRGRRNQLKIDGVREEFFLTYPKKEPPPVSKKLPGG